MVASGQVVTFQLWRPVWGKVYLVSGSLRGGGGVFRAVTDSGGHYTSRPDPPAHSYGIVCPQTWKLSPKVSLWSLNLTSLQHVTFWSGCQFRDKKTCTLNNRRHPNLLIAEIMP